MSSFKVQRTADMLRNFLGIELVRLADPRLMLVTVTGVDMSPDLKNAWVYWSVMTVSPPLPEDAPADAEPPPPVAPSAQRIAEIEEALESAGYMLKRRIGKELGLRYVPQLVFRRDHSLDTANRIEHLVKHAGPN